MRQFLTTSAIAFVSLVLGLCIGIWIDPEIRNSPQGLWVKSQLCKAPWGAANTDENCAYESYDYPTIKWRAKPVPDKPGAIAQLWTRYEKNEGDRTGKMNYRLTMFKAADRSTVEVQILDDAGFKIAEFQASDFHLIPGATDIMEARDSYACTEEQYKKVRDYSIK